MRSNPRTAKRDVVVVLAGLLLGAAVGAIWYFAPPSWRSVDGITTAVGGLWHRPSSMAWLSHRLSLFAREVAKVPHMLSVCVVLAVLVLHRPLSLFLGQSNSD
jgi:hypothetical protein